MMVTAACDMDLNVISILSTLQSKTSSHEDRTEAYLQFSNNMKDDDVSLFSLDVSKHATQILSVIEKDVLGDNTDVSQGALQVLGFVLHDNEIVRSLSSDVSASILSVLCQCVLKTEDKTTCTRALWCLSKQSLSPDIIVKNLHSLRCALEHALTKWKSQSVTVEHEAFNVIARLLEKCPKEMKQQVVWWAKLLLPLLVHNAIKVRERVLELIQSELPTLMTHQVELSKFLENDFNKKFADELTKLYMMKSEVHVLNCWGVIVQLLGEILHQGSSLINILLPIVELGFKSPSPEIKCLTFQAWQQLVNNFASNHSILTDPRRVKLIMQVFKINNAKVESVAKVKLQVWWHFVWLLGSKVSALFDQVCVPLLQFCMGNRLGLQTAVTTPRGLKNGTGPITPQLNLSNISGNSQTPVFSVLQHQCCEILAHFLGNIPNDLDVETPQYSLDPLSHDVVTGPAFFIKHANLFITTTTELICSLGKDIPEKLLHQIWYSLVAHMKNALENLKSEMREILSTFLTQFQIIVLSQALPHKSVLRLFEAVCCLPRKSLCSTAYNVSSGEKIHGTPALFLTELLLTPVLLHSSSMMTGYMVLVSKLVECGMGNTSGSLEYCQAALKMLSQNVNFVCGPETVWRLWSSIINPLHEQIKKTNEVNQGDALEHNFSCMYSILMFPVQQKLPANMPQLSVKTLMKTWCDVYRTFARLTALVANAEANICCEELCNKLVKAVTKEDMEDLLFLDFMVHICLAVVNCVDFSSLGMLNTFNLNSLSPAKWTKRKQKPMENIQSLVAVVCFLLDCITKTSTCETSKKTSNSLSLQSPANNMVDLLSVLYTHVSASSVILSMIGQLSKPVSELYHGASMKTAAKIYNNAFMQKLEKLWEDICTCVQSKLLSEPMDSQLLRKLSPLLESTFLHSRRNIKHQTASFWKATFGKAASLEYPDSLQPVLLKVKEKNPLPLPGWASTTTIPVIEETPVSQMSQSQAPEPHIPGMPSPRRIHGSFLNKAISPNIKKSPAKPENSPVADGAKKNILSVYDFTNQDFVVIKSPPKKRRVLTEHQKEVLKEKKSFPAMYNNLDVSQDVSLMASQFSSDTQTQPETPNPPSDSVIVIGSQQSEEMDVTQQPSASLLNVRKTKSPASESSDKADGHKRSVRFKDSQEEDIPKQALSSSPPDITSKSIEHFSIIKALSQSNNVITISSESQKGADSQSPDSAGSNIPATVDDGIPQNVLGAVGAYDLLSSKSSSIESKKNASGSLPSSNLDSQTDSDKNSDQPLLSWSNQLKSLSQTSTQNSQELKTSQGSLSSQTELKKSQSSPRLLKSPLRSSQSLKSKSSQEKKDELLAQKRLDSWIMKSPNKRSDNSAEVNKTNASGQNKIVGPTVVEETQSPKKDMAGKSPSNLLNEALPSILETPPRPSPLTNSEDSNSRSSIKKLFTEGTDDADVSMDSDNSNIIPSSPCNSKTLSKLGTPVLKLKRLTDEEIKHFSPKHREHKEMESPRQTTKTVAEGTEHDMTEHEHDDFSAIRPLDSEDIIPSSQGFVPCETKVFKVSVKSSHNANTSQDNMHDGKMVVENKVHEGSNSGKAGQEKKTPCSENLFTEDALFDDELYNPMLNNTFDNVADVTPSKLCNQQNLQEESQNLQSSQDSEESCKLNSNSEKASKSPEEYDPKQASTLGSDAELKTPRRGRKRKQDTPKKMSPDSIKPKRRRPNKTTEKTENKIPENGSVGNKGSDNNEKTNQAETKEIQNQSVRRITPEKQDVITICDPEFNSSQTPRLRGRPRKSTTTTPSMSQRKRRERKTEADLSVPEDVTVVEVHRNFDEQKKLVDENSNLEKTVEQSTQSGQDSMNELDKISDQAIILGQKTPETTTLQTVPQRKSTTKKKMEQAQKWLQNKEKAVVVNSGGSNLDSDSSDDDRPLKKSAKKLNGFEDDPSKSTGKAQSCENETQEPENDEISDDDLMLLKEAERMDDEAALPSQETKDENMERDKSSGNSEDDLPLSDLSKKRLIKDQEDNDDNKDQSAKGDNSIKDSSIKDTFSEELLKEDVSNSIGENNDPLSQDVVDLTSSQSQKIKKGRKKKKVPTVKSTLRLRSSELFLRTGKPVRKSTEKVIPAKSLRLKKVKNLDGKKEKATTAWSKTEDKINDDGGVDNVQAEGCEKVENGGQNEVTALAVSDQEQVSSSNEEINKSTVDKSATELNAVDGPVESKEETQVSERDIDETPRKVPDKEMIVPSAFSLFERHSDSKLITVSRKFDKKRPVIARRSILKPSTTQSSSLGSPSNKKPFYPIKVGHIYSPSASPSAGILKRRRLSGDKATNSPSPPSKQRRVSFSEPLTFEKEQLTNADNIRTEIGRPHSPLVTSAATKVSSSLEKFFTTPAIGSDTCVNSSSEKQDSQVTQGSYRSTQESQLNATQPIYPELLECSVNVERVLPQLTSSMWMRGLGQLVRARKIHTVGDLSALTEREVDNLPIRSPKISTVRTALRRFESQEEAKKNKSGKSEPAVCTETSQDAADDELNNSVADVMTSSSEVLAKVSDVINQDRNSDVFEDILNCTEHVNSNNRNDKSNDGASVDSASSAVELKTGKMSLLQKIEDISMQCQVDDLKDLKMEEIFKIQHHLSSMSNTVMAVLKAKCNTMDSANS